MQRQWHRHLHLGVCILLLAGLACTARSAPGDLALTGLAMHRETGRNIYLAALQTNASLLAVEDIASVAAPRVMLFQVVARRTSIRSLLGGILLQSELATGTSADASTQDLARQLMQATRGSLYAGDQLRIFSAPDQGTVITLNGAELARVASDQAFAYLVRGWVGERGASTAFRDTLLAQGIDPALEEQYHQLKPSAERIATVASWSETQATASTTAEPAEAVVASAPEVALAATQADTATVADVDAPAPRDPEEASTGMANTEPATLMAAQVAADDASPELAAGSVQPADAAEITPATPAASTPTLASIAPRPQLREEAPVIEILEAELSEVERARALDVREYSQRLAIFNHQVFVLVNSRIKYPRSAVRRNIQGALELDLTLDTSGRLQAVEVAQSSGHSMLDDAARKAAKEALEKPLEGPLDSVAVAEYGADSGALVIPVPVQFVLME